MTWGYCIAKRFCSKYFITLTCLSICLKMILHQTVGLWLEKWVWSYEISRQCCDRFSCHLVLGGTVYTNTSLEFSIWHRSDSTHMYSHSKSSLGIKLDALIRVREPDIGKSDAHVVLRRFFKKEYSLSSCDHFATKSNKKSKRFSDFIQVLA